MVVGLAVMTWKRYNSKHCYRRYCFESDGDDNYDYDAVMMI
jgi:hypothetical protein